MGHLEKPTESSPQGIPGAGKKEARVPIRIVPREEEQEETGRPGMRGQRSIFLLRGSENNKRNREGLPVNIERKGSKGGKFGSSNHQHENIQTLLLFSLSFFSSLNSSNC